MGFVKLNKGEGTVTMSFAAYKAVYHDSLMLHLLLRTELSTGFEGRIDLLKDYISNQFLGCGFTYCQSPMCDKDTWDYVFEKKTKEDEEDA
jgi:hypothetical protein